MDNGRNHSSHMIQSCSPLVTDDNGHTTFEFAYPTNDVAESESNKSTPYFTPLEYFQNSFEFPSPTLEKLTPESSPTLPPAATTSVGSGCEAMPRFLDYRKPSPPKTAATMVTKQQPSTSPGLHRRKLRRFSLYERRSCSPQHLLLKNTCSPVDSNNAHVTLGFVNDKENTKPRISEHSIEETVPFASQSGNSSPALVEDTNSPNIMTASESRLTYSPKLLASINNINLGGSPLGIINSAGYKNGNYFRFPEVDYVVNVENTSATQQQHDEEIGHCDNQLLGQQKHNVCIYLGSAPSVLPAHQKARFKIDNSTSENSEKSERWKKLPVSVKSDKKNRKNKNNLTIKISDANNTHLPPQSPPVKAKTPTIRTTKEKALSLDSAADNFRHAASAFDADHHRNHSCIDSDDQINPKDPQTDAIAAVHSKARSTAENRSDLQSEKPTNRSTSLSQLSTLAANTSNLCASSSTVHSGPKTNARKMVSESNNEWCHSLRKQSQFVQRSNSKPFKPSERPQSAVNKSLLPTEEAAVHVEKSYPKYIKSSPSQPQPPPATTLRGLHKHNPLLHSSSTNLKTLPEFLTLVEFTNSSPAPPHMDTAAYPIKGKSFDQTGVSVGPTGPPAASFLREKNASNSATNLLQRRGSNHSLTLNLHGSCGNLLGNCRSGLSVSNYSLASAANSTTKLNSKSSLTLDSSAAVSNAQALRVQSQSASKSQAVKQSLFSRRGSNNSLVLHLSTTSCGNLNSFPSQSSLSTESNKLTTTKFVTPTKSTTSDSVVSQKRGLLERRGSHQSLTLNMSGAHAGLGGNEHGLNVATRRNVVEALKMPSGDTECAVAKSSQNLLPIACPQTHQRKFFSSENLTKANTQFSDLNHAHKRNSQQVCFGSVSDLKPSASGADQTPATATATATAINSQRSLNREQLDFQECTVCTCTGVRNITTRPLSPQTTSEEFKIYLANIQMLQNASNPLSQHDLIKLNYIFDNSYASNAASSLAASVSMLSTTEANHRQGGALLTTSEDCEISARYQHVLSAQLPSIELQEEEQKRLFRELHKEFWDLPLNHQEKPMVFGSQSKNRYKTILPNENSRVLLENEWKFILRGSDALESELLVSERDREYVVSTEAPYINANYIKGPDFTSKCYVATQGPLPNTIFDFWLMVYQNSQRHQELLQSTTNNDPTTPEDKLKLQLYDQKIVMLTNFSENQRQKCSVYFPVDLNEIFVTTGNHATVRISKELEEFFHAYLMPIETVAREGLQTNCRLNYLRVELPVDLNTVLPNNTNYFVIKNVGIVKKNGFSIRKFNALYCVNPSSITQTTAECCSSLLLRSFSCYHYWYPDWPDHRSPKDINTLLDICLHILDLGRCEEEFGTFCDQQPSPPLLRNCANAQHVDRYQQDIFNDVQPLPVIHCSAGIGRTGCLIAILNAVRQVRQSLAFSLISMAQQLPSQCESNGSPVDFRLPAQFVQQFSDEVFEESIQRYSYGSYSRNTFLYVNYILNKSRSARRQEAVQETMPNRAKLNQTNEDEKRVSTPNLFTLADHASFQMAELSELPKIPDVYVDILGIVCNLRLQRGGMVQNSEQYELIHRAICLYLKRTLALKHF